MDKATKISQNNGTKFSFFDAADYLLSSETERAQEILKKRFGLSEAEPQTLEKIGGDYKITRERVRQIIADVMRRAAQRKSDHNFKQAEEKIVFTIEGNSGIIEESKILEDLGGGEAKEAHAIVFFGELSSRVAVSEEKDLVKKSWTVSTDVLGKVKKVADAAVEIFEKEKMLLAEAEIIEKINQVLTVKEIVFSKKQIADYLSVLVSVQKNKFAKWGMSGWKEINPKGTRERIYMVLKENKEPLHFSEIAKLIDRYKLSKKKAHPQTVHNELIKDDRFILVGRGIYALREWGYKSGTIQEVLEDILKKSQKPLTKEAIVAEVMKLRKVKKATIMINLNNPKFFVKVDNSYTIKKQS
jgi:DNA-directed RNA polymerase delta subunit